MTPLPRRLGTLAALGAALAWAQPVAAGECARAFHQEAEYPGELGDYEIARAAGLRPREDLAPFAPSVGWTVTERGPDGRARRARLRVLSDHPGEEILLVGDANGWGIEGARAGRPGADRLHRVGETPYFEGEFEVRHGMEYRLKVSGRDLLDPGAPAYTPASVERLNSVFWDFEHPGHYRMRFPAPDLRGRPVAIGETDVHALVARWPRPDGGRGPARREDTYRFIAESGVIEELARHYNAVEFVPVAASLDDPRWNFRYLVYGGFAPDASNGTPEDFMRMVDAFNRAGIAVVFDAVVGHYPWRGNEGLREIEPIGLHRWRKQDGSSLYGERPSPWKTLRYDYQNPFVRRFLVDGVMTFLERYRAGWVRIDNAFDVRDLPGGEDLLRELHEEMAARRPDAYRFDEIFGPSRGALLRRDRGGAGVHLRNDQGHFDFFKDNALRPWREIDMDWLREVIRAPWDKRELARILYVTNHDEAANPRWGATGQYLPSLFRQLGKLGWDEARARSRAYNALAMLIGSFHLDMPQARLLQEGNFTHDPAVRWELRESPEHRANYELMGELSRLFRSEPAFAFQNQDRRGSRTTSTRTTR